jgi:hypothetical protein
MVSIVQVSDDGAAILRDTTAAASPASIQRDRRQDRGLDMGISNHTLFRRLKVSHLKMS